MTMAQKRERILPRLIEEEMRESFLDYSMSVIVQRALPDVRDGLKPVHRRILFAMHEAGLRPDRPYKKSATVVGDVLGKYHPHGDTAVYDTMVRMVQEFSMRYPLIDGQGNFGSIDGDSAAAYRYTEARLSSAASEMLVDIERATVDFIPNFDNRLEEPSVLPSALPNLLVNGSSGIAVGMSTNIPPHNLPEVASALRALADDPEIGIAELMESLPGPDFPTGGFIVGDEGIEDMYREGKGRIVMRARVVREALRHGKEQLVVTELPYTVNKSKIIEQIAGLSRKGKLDDVTELRDESDRDGIRVVIELKRGADADQVLAVLFKKTYLQYTFGAIVIALDEGQPRQLDLKQILEKFRDHRLEVIRRRSQHELENAESERHVVQGLIVALDDIDRVIEIIRSSEDRPEASERLQDTFGLSEVQADAILNMRLGRLTALEQEELRARLEGLEKRIEELREILGSEGRQLRVMLDELEELEEEYGDPRRTQILRDAEEDEAALEDTVADEDVVVTVSHEGYVKRMPMYLYRRRVTTGKALAGMERYEDDYLERIFLARTRGWILCFTAGGRCHFLPVLDVPESSRASRGQSLYGLLGADRDDPIVSLVPVDDLAEPDRTLLFVTEGGICKRTELGEFSNPRSGGVIAAGTKGGDRILDVVLSDGTAEVMLLTRDGRAIRFPEAEISVMGRTAQGVKGIDLKDDDQVVGILLVRRAATLLTVTEDGKGKRTEIEEFPLQKRGGLGTLVTPGDDAPDLVAALEVLHGDEVMVVEASGKVHRVRADGIPVQGRRTQGIRLVTLEGEDRVVEVTRAYKSREENPLSGSMDGGEGGDDNADADTGVVGATDGAETEGSGADGAEGSGSHEGETGEKLEPTPAGAGDEDADPDTQFDLLAEDEGT
ncbi:MAG: DNA gyrase subunit A [Longimicrobiales bacterium]